MSWYFSYHKFLVCSFQGTFLTVLSVIRNLNLFKSLITGKSSSMLTALPCWLGWLDYFQISTVLLFRLVCIYMKSFRLFYFWIRQPPTLPHRHQCSTIGRLGLNHRVRDGNGCFPQAHRHRKVLCSVVLLPNLDLRLAKSRRTSFVLRLNFVSPSTRAKEHS